MKKRGIMWLMLLLTMCVIATPAEAKRKKNNRQESAARLAPSEQARFDRVFFRAATLHQRGDIDQAWALYQRALEIDSLSGPVLNQISVYYYALKDMESAQRYAEKAVAQDSANYWYNRQLGLIYAHSKQDSAAIQVYKRVARLYPQKSEPWYDLAQSYLRIDSLTECVAALDKIEEMDGVNPQLTLQRFYILQQQGKTAEAFESYDRLIQRYPYDITYRINKGDMQMSNGMIAEAKATYDEAARIEPDNAYLWVALSNYYSVTGNQTAADTLVEAALVNPNLDVRTKIDILTEYLKSSLRKVAEEKRKAQDTTDIQIPGVEELFEKVATMHPTEPEIYVLHSDYLSAIHQEARAEQQMRFAVDLKPTEEDYWTRLLQSAFIVGDTVNVVKYCDEAVHNIPESYVPWMFRAYLAMDRDHYLEAIENFRMVVDHLKPEEVNRKSTYLGSIGDAYHQLATEDKKNATYWMKKAYESYDEALKYNPKNILVLNNYAYFLSLEKRDLNKAEAMAAKVVKENPDSPTYLDTYAWIYFQQGNYMLAKFYQDMALKKSENDPSATLWEHYGDILMMQGEVEKALGYWLKASKMDGVENPEILKQKIDTEKYIETQPDWL